MIEWIVIGFVLMFLFAGIRIVRPVEKGLIETLGKYSKTAEQGFHWIIPIIQHMIKVNITEQMVDVPPQMVQTSDKLNTEVDAVVYYQVKDVKAAEYNVDDHRAQLTKLSRTTLRAVIGGMSLAECIKERAKINVSVEKVLDKETDSYGVNVLRVEVQRIEPPEDVQKAMNEVVKAVQEKTAAIDFATATETKADGERRAKIKMADGEKKGTILIAQGKAKAIELENTALRTYFKDEAQVFKKLQTTENALKKGSKFVIDPNTNITNVMSEVSGVTPIKGFKK